MELAGEFVSVLCGCVHVIVGEDVRRATEWFVAVFLQGESYTR